MNDNECLCWGICSWESLLSGELWSTINHGGHGEHSESRFRDKICFVEQDLMRILRCVRSVRCGILTHRYISTTASKTKSLQEKLSKAPVNVKVIDAARVKGSDNYPRFYSGQQWLGIWNKVGYPYELREHLFDVIKHRVSTSLDPNSKLSHLNAKG